MDIRKVFGSRGPAGFTTMLLSSIPPAAVDILIAGMTWREMLAARGIYALIKSILGGRYDAIRDMLIEEIAKGRGVSVEESNAKYFVDLTWYPLFHVMIYSLISFIIGIPFQDAMKAITFIAITSPIGGLIVGRLLDLLKKLWKRFLKWYSP